MKKLGLFSVLALGTCGLLVGCEPTHETPVETTPPAAETVETDAVGVDADGTVVEEEAVETTAE